MTSSRFDQLSSGTHADLVVVTLHRMVVAGGDRLAALHNCFLTVLCNVSPYARSLSLVAAVKLVSLFELFTSPRVLYAAEGNHQYVALLLEIFNNVIQYQRLTVLPPRRAPREADTHAHARTHTMPPRRASREEHTRTHPP